MELTKQRVLIAVPIILAAIGVIGDVGGAYSTCKDLFRFLYRTQISLIWFPGIILISAVSFLIFWKQNHKSNRDPNQVLSALSCDLLSSGELS